MKSRIPAVCILGLAIAPALAGAEFAAGHLFVTSYGTHRVVEIDAAGNVVGDLGSGTPLSGPWGLAFRPDGTLAVASRENDEIIRFGPGGVFLGGVADIALDGPQGLAIGPSGRVYVASTHNDRVIAYERTGPTFTTVMSQPAFPIDGPTMLSFTADQRLLVGSFFNDLLCECTDNGIPTAVMPLLADAPECVSLGGAGTMLLVSSADTKLRALAASKFVLPDLDLAIPGAVTPMGACESPDGRIAVASAGNDRVLLVQGAASVAWGLGAVASPIGVAYAPWWFEARVQGEILPAQSNVVATIDDVVRLALFPGSGRAFVVPVDAAASSHLATHFGPAPLVLHGTELRDLKGSKQRVFHGQQRSLDAADTPNASIGLVLKQTSKNGVLDVTSAKGTLHVASGSLVFRGSIQTIAALN